MKIQMCLLSFDYISILDNIIHVRRLHIIKAFFKSESADTVYFSYFSTKTYIVGIIKSALLSIPNTCFFVMK